MNIHDNAYYDEYTRYMESYGEYKISEIAENLAIAIQKRTGERIKDWSFQYKAISDIAEHVYITDVDELESSLNKFNLSEIHPNLTAIELKAAIWEALEL